MTSELKAQADALPVHHFAKTGEHRTRPYYSEADVAAVLAENAKLRAALDAILNGTMLDRLNHNDDGLSDFQSWRTPTTNDVKRWAGIAKDALNAVRKPAQGVGPG